MRIYLIGLGASLLAAAVAVSLTSDGVFAQTTPAAQKPAAATKAPIKRLADGHPDLQGTYDIATLTPVDRPRAVKNLVLTEQEAVAMEKYEAQRQVKNDAPLKGDRGAPPVGGETTAPKSYLEFLEQAGGGVVGGYNNFWLSGGDRVIRVDGQPRSSIIIDPPDGQVPPMKPEAVKRNPAFLAGAAATDASESGNGAPPLPNYFYNSLKQIAQTKDTVVILVERVHGARVIRMNAEHLPPTIRKWMGDSVGHWEGHTLGVDTTNFTGKTQFRGSGENLHVVERFTRVNPKTILYRFTVEDPTTWDRSWTGEYPWNATDEHIYEYACHEGNYSLGGMLRGARQKEAEEAAQKSKK